MWFKTETDIDTLIARGKLEKAAVQLRQKLAGDPKNLAVRQQLGDVLGRAGKPQEAVATLAPLVNSYSREGFATKAIAVVKKIERLDPGRDDIDRLIDRVQREADEPLGEPPQLIRGHESPVPAPRTTTVKGAGQVEDVKPEVGRKVPFATSKLEHDWLDRAANRTNFHWSSVLRPLSGNELRETLGGLKLITKHSGAIICGQGEPAKSLFVLATGFARAYRREDVSYRQVEVIEEGQFFGEESYFDDEPKRRSTVTAASDCELLEIDLPTLRSILLARHAVMEQLEGAYRCRP